MLAFRPVSIEQPKTDSFEEDIDPEEDIIKLYFNLFDINQSGKIDQDELKICLENLLPEGQFTNSNQLIAAQSEINPITLVNNILEIFQVVDTSKDGYIDYEEFKKFYRTIMRQSSHQLSPMDISHDLNYSMKSEITSYEIDTPTNKESRTKSIPTPPRSASPPPPEKNRAYSSPFRPPNPLSTTTRSHSPTPPERKKDLLNLQTPPNSTSPPNPHNSTNLRNSTNSEVPPPSLSEVPPAPTTANTSPVPVRKGVSNGLASRMQGLDPSKIIMPGVPMPGMAKKTSNSPMIIQKQRTESTESTGLNIEAHLKRGTLRTIKPRHRRVTRKKSSAGLIKTNLEALEKPIEKIV